MANEYECPRCGEAVDSRGLAPHLSWAHDISGEKSQQLAEEIRESDSQDGIAQSESRESHEPDGPATASDAGPIGAAAPEGDVDALDDAIAELVRRREQRERIKTVRELQEPESDESGRSPLSELQEVAEVMRTLQGVVDDGGDDTPAEDAVRRAVREEVARTADARADGAGHPSDPVAAAVANGVTDPDALGQIASIERSSPWASVANRLVDSIDGDTVGRLAEVGATLLQSRPEPARAAPTRGPRVGDERQEPEPESEPANPGQDRLENARDRIERARETAEDDGGDADE